MGRLALLFLVIVVTHLINAVKFTENDEEITPQSRSKYRQETLHHSHVREWIEGPDGRVYQFHAGEQSWLHAREFCLSQNSELVIIRSKEQLDWLLSHYAPTYTRFNERYMQIGLLMPDGPNRDWVYLDGSPYNQSVVSWLSGEPFDHSIDGRERCGILRVHARVLDDIDCEAPPSPNVRMRFICEREQNVHKEQQKSQNFIWSKLEKLFEFFGFANGSTPVTKPQNSTESSEDYEDEVKKLNISSTEAERVKNIKVDKETSSEEQKSVEAALSILNKVSKPGEKAESMPEEEEEEEEETSRPGSQEDRPHSSTELLSGSKISTQAKIFIESTPITEAPNAATEAENTTEAITDGVTVKTEDTTPVTEGTSVTTEEATVAPEETTVTAEETKTTVEETKATVEETKATTEEKTTVTTEETNVTKEETNATAQETNATAEETKTTAEETKTTAEETTVTTEATTITNEATDVETTIAETTADVTTVATSAEAARAHGTPLKEISETEGSGVGVERAEIQEHDESANVTEIDPEKLEEVISTMEKMIDKLEKIQVRDTKKEKEKEKKEKKKAGKKDSLKKETAKKVKTKQSLVKISEKIKEDLETATAMESDFDEDANKSMPSTDIKPPEEDCDEEASGENYTTSNPNEEIMRNSVDTEDVDDLSQKPKIPAEKEAHIQDFLITLRTFLSRAEHSDLRKLLDQHPEKTLLEKMKLAIKAANEREFERMKELALMKKHGVDISHVPEPKLMGESEREELYKKISRVVMVEAEKKDDETITQPSAVRTTTQESHREKKSQAKGVVIKNASDDSEAEKETVKVNKSKSGKLKDAASVIDEDNEKKQSRSNKVEEENKIKDKREDKPTSQERNEEEKPKKEEKTEKKTEKKAEQEKKESGADKKSSAEMPARTVQLKEFENKEEIMSLESKIEELEEKVKLKEKGKSKNLVSNDEEGVGDLTKKEESTKAKKESTTESTTSVKKDDKDTVTKKSVTAEFKALEKDVRPEAEDDNSFDSEHVDKSILDDSFDSDQVDRDDELTRTTGEEVEEEVSTVKIPPPKEEEVGTEKTPSAIRKEKRRQERLRRMKDKMEKKEKKGKPGKTEATKSTTENSNYDKANVSHEDDDDSDSEEVPAFPTLPTLPTLPPLGQTLPAQTLPTLPPLTPPPGFDNLLQTFSENWRKIFPDAKIPTFKAEE